MIGSISLLDTLFAHPKFLPEIFLLNIDASDVPPFLWVLTRVAPATLDHNAIGKGTKIKELKNDFVPNCYYSYSCYHYDFAAA
jgi:hypothetical protein